MGSKASKVAAKQKTAKKSVFFVVMMNLTPSQVLGPSCQYATANDRTAIPRRDWRLETGPTGQGVPIPVYPVCSPELLRPTPK